MIHDDVVVWMARKANSPSNSERYRPYNTSDYYQVNAGTSRYYKKSTSSRWKKYCFYVLISAILLFFLLLVSLFVVLPIIFMNSVDFQRSLIFRRWESDNDVEFTNFQKYGMDGARNLYVDITRQNENITLGLWQILSSQESYNSIDSNQIDYDFALRFSKSPILLIFHDESTNRADNVNLYWMLRKFFHIIVFDYRGYGDSTAAVLTEKSVVEDSVQLYKWLKRKTHSEVFVWGHSLGGSISTQTIARLRYDGVKPTGLFLYAPFTTLREDLETNHPYFKYFSWLPWFNQTILDPLEENGFEFRTIENILSVDCPVMIFHSEDDDVVSYTLSEKVFLMKFLNSFSGPFLQLYQIAADMRDYETKGRISLHVLPSSLKLGHDKIYGGSDVIDYIKDHIKTCQKFRPEKLYL